MAAATDTRQYMAALKRDKKNQSYESESRIAQLWSKAGIDMLPVNSELATRCLIKADYWADTVGWSDAQKDDKMIKLDDLLDLGRQIPVPQPGHRSFI